jgi:hypothetical protein
VLPQHAYDQGKLLAVDLGLRTGLAVFDGGGRLLACASRHFANRAALKRASRAVLRRFGALTHLVVEGGGTLAACWLAEAEKLGLSCRSVTAEEWRGVLLSARERRDPRLKLTAVEACRRVRASAHASRGRPPRHDAAEAILAGHYVVTRMGWT